MKTDQLYNTNTLADHVSQQLTGWNVEGLVFTTFQYENDTFNDLVLPAFLERQVRPYRAVFRKVTEQLTRLNLPYGCTVFADHRSIREGEYGATGVIDLVPVFQQAIFHPKVCIALLRSERQKRDQRRQRAVFVMVSSANLTKNGWQSNVEGVASRLLVGDQRTPLVDDVQGLLCKLKNEDRRKRPTYAQFCDEYEKIFANDIPTEKSRNAKRPEKSHNAKRPVKSPNDRLIISGYENGGDNGTSFPQQIRDLLAPILQDRLETMALEVISPYTSTEGNGEPLRELITATRPQAVTVMVPMQTGSVMNWTADTVDYLRAQGGNALTFGKLDDAVLSNPDPDFTHNRSVHAKMYRWRSTTGLPVEASVVGSHNLTTQAFSGKQNIEVSMLVVEYPTTQGGPKPWLEPISMQEVTPSQEQPDDTDGDQWEEPLPICLVYDWKTFRLEITSTDGAGHRVELYVHSHKFEAEASALPQAINLSVDESAAVHKYLCARAFVEVHCQTTKTTQWVFVEQLNMESKPWLHSEITLEDLIKHFTTDDFRPKDEAAYGGKCPRRTCATTPRTTAFETLHDRLAGLLRVPIALHVRITNARVNQPEQEHDAVLSYLRRTLNKTSPYSLWRFVECLMSERQNKFAPEDRYLTLAALANEIESISAVTGARPEYKRWVRSEQSTLDELLKRIKKHRRELRATLVTKLSNEGADAVRLLKWLDEQIKRTPEV